MWNPPLVDEDAGIRGSALSEAAQLLAELMQAEVRTICFLKSRRGVELIQRFTKLRLEDAGRGDLAERIAPYRAGYTPTQRREIERRLVRGRPAGGGRDRRARAGDRRGRPRRGDLRDLPRHRRQPAPDVGPRRAARHRPRAVRGRRRRARPVLLPPPRRVPRPARRAGDPRPRVGGDPHAAPGRGRLRAAALRRRRRHARPALGGCTPSASSRTAACASGAAATRRAPTSSRPAASRCARPESTRSPWSSRTAAS